MRSLEWALSQYDCCPYMKKKFRHRKVQRYKGKKFQRHICRHTHTSIYTHISVAITRQRERSGKTTFV
jgi:DNA-binding FadR family transcriptional regulator